MFPRVLLAYEVKRTLSTWNFFLVCFKMAQSLYNKSWIVLVLYCIVGTKIFFLIPQLLCFSLPVLFSLFSLLSNFHVLKHLYFSKYMNYFLAFSLHLPNLLHRALTFFIWLPNKILFCLCQERPSFAEKLPCHDASGLWQTNRCVYCNQWIIQAQKLQTSHLSVTDLFLWQSKIVCYHLCCKTCVSTLLGVVQLPRWRKRIFTLDSDLILKG